MPFGHETWFIEDVYSADWGNLTETLTLAALIGAVVITLAWRVAARWFPGVDIPFLGRIAAFMPFVVRIHLAVSLVGLLSLGFYLSPAMDLHFDVVGVLLGAVMIVVAIGMVAGWHSRPAALLLLVAGPIGMLEFGVLDVLQRIDLFGTALFVLAAGPGRWSADNELGRAAEPKLADVAIAVWALRVSTGVALIIVALVEKLAQPDLALAFLDRYPQFNVAQQIGFGWSDLEFAQVAGGIEVLFGLLLISGAIPQLVVIAAGIPFNATLFFFGDVELLGHLPVYGTMLVLLVYGSSPVYRPLVSELWPFGRAPTREPQLE